MILVKDLLRYERNTRTNLIFMIFQLKGCKREPKLHQFYKDWVILRNII